MLEEPVISWIHRDMTYGLIVRPVLKFFDSENAHGLSIKVGSVLASTYAGQKILGYLYKTPSLPIEALGLNFRHPLGLAAGMDKKCEALQLWPSIGFSWTEGGGITYHPQDGNPRPRMFRSDSERALVNRMGFNNPGAVASRNNLVSIMDSGNWPRTPLALNIGCSKVSVNDDRPEDDYIATLNQLWDLGDLFVINASSPNTVGLRDLGQSNKLNNLLRSIENFRSTRGESRPVLFKISPDASDTEIEMMVDVALDNGIDGFVAVNTTTSRPRPTSTRSRKAFSEDGGLSGRPLRDRSLDVIRIIHNRAGRNYPIVGVGGIDGPDSAWDAITSGATLLQLYSALVFNGPSVVKKTIRGLKRKLDQEGIENIQDAVGIHSSTNQ